MTPGQKRTARFLGVCALAILLVFLAGLGWEFYTLTLNDHATITETIQVMWAEQPWPFLIVGLLVCAAVFFLLGHFFSAPSEHYENIRRRGFVLLILAVGSASCGLSVKDLCRLRPDLCAPLPSPTEAPPVSPEPPKPSPQSSPSPSPECFDNRPGPDVGAPIRVPCDDCRATGCAAGESCVAGDPIYVCRPKAPPSPQATPTPVATPKPPKPCRIDPDKLPCWLTRQRLDWEVTRGDGSWIEVGEINGNLFRGTRGNVVMYIRCDGKGPFAECYSTRPDGAFDPSLHPPGHGSVFGTWFPEGFYDERTNPGGNKEHVGQGICAASYLAGLCPKPSPTPEVSPGPTPTPGATPQPGPTPGTCPALVKWGGGLHAQMTPDFQGLPKVPFFAGNTADIDTTARFGGSAGGRGLPCNDEHHAVCEASGIDDGPNWRRCEDPRGPIITPTSCGYEKAKVINGGWGLRLIGVHRGKCCVRIEPRSDVQDAEGRPVRVLGNPATEPCFEAQ